MRSDPAELTAENEIEDDERGDDPDAEDGGVEGDGAAAEVEWLPVTAEGVAFPDEAFFAAEEDVRF